MSPSPVPSTPSRSGQVLTSSPRCQAPCRLLRKRTPTITGSPAISLNFQQQRILDLLAVRFADTAVFCKGFPLCHYICYLRDDFFGAAGVPVEMCKPSCSLHVDFRPVIGTIETFCHKMVAIPFGKEGAEVHVNFALYSHFIVCKFNVADSARIVCQFIMFLINPSVEFQ